MDLEHELEEVQAENLRLSQAVSQMGPLSNSGSRRQRKQLEEKAERLVQMECVLETAITRTEEAEGYC